MEGIGGWTASIGSSFCSGSRGHFNLGIDIDKAGRLKCFNNWIKGAQAKSEFMGLIRDRQMISLLCRWAGPELLTYWEREVGIRFEDIPGVQAEGGSCRDEGLEPR